MILDIIFDFRLHKKRTKDSDTYLQVSSGYSTGDQGYVLVNNNSMEIQEALIVNIS